MTMVHNGFGTGAVGAAPGAQARGSQGASAGLAEDGAEMALEAAVEDALEGAGAVVADELAEPVVVVVAVAGAFTANWLPVTTVTWAPSVTWLGSYAMMTEPLIW